MKYRVIKQRLIQLKNGTAERVGDVFDGADVENYVSVSELERRGYIEPVADEPAKVTKEVAEAPVRKRRGRPKKDA